MAAHAFMRLRSEWYRVARLLTRQDGQGMVEYALILLFIALVLIIITQVLGKQVNNVFSNISNGLSQ